MFISEAQCHRQNMIHQCEKNVQNSVQQSNVSDECIKLTNGILFARPLNGEAVMVISVSGELHENYNERLENITQPIVLSTLDSMNIVFKRQWAIEVLSMSQTTTLFSFLDYQAKSPRDFFESTVDHTQSSLLMHTKRNLVLLVEAECKSIMDMLILTLLNPQDRRLESLYTFIRSVESYWIAHFLLSQIMNEGKDSESPKIGNACKNYGVSESYFRKLCHRTFTRGPKKQLRLWRAARSVLQLIEKDNSIVAIAGDNGYASSSHFSSEIKSLFGITPKEFKKLEDFLHE